MADAKVKAALEAERMELDELKRQLVEQRKQLLADGKKQAEEMSVLKKQMADQKEKLRTTMLQKNFLEAQVQQSSSGGGIAQNVVVHSSGLGSLKEFNLTGDWSLWCERLEQYIVANSVPENKMVALLLTLLGTEGYSLLRNLCAPQRPSQKNFEELTDIMRDHLQPKPIEITERYRFKECRQKEGEEVKQYLARLKRLALHCEFGSNLEASLRDQFVWGIRSDAIKRKLLGEPGLTNARAVEIAIALETASRDVAEMGASSRGNEEGVDFFRDKRTGSSYKKAQASTLKCFCCGKEGHKVAQCRFRLYKCNICQKEGHLASVCKNAANSRSKNSHATKVEERKESDKNKKSKKKSGEKHHYVDEVEDLETALDNLFCIKDESVRDIVSNMDEETVNDEPMFVNISVENVTIKFEIDTGSPITAISVRDFKQREELSKLTLRETSRRFKSHAGHPIVPSGILEVMVGSKRQNRVLELFVLPGKGPPIVGRQWIRALQIPMNGKSGNSQAIPSICSVVPVDVSSIVREYPSVFTDKLGTYTKKMFKLNVKENAIPVFCKPRPLPYALRDKVERELNRLVSEKIVEPVESSQWATPIVPILKRNGQIRICGDYKITVNPNLQIDRYPIPRVQDLLATLNGGKVFSKLDLSNAYQQVKLDEESQKLVTISTHKGLFLYKRLCFGVASAPGLFQREMEQVLQGIEGVICFFDDILVSGSTVEEHAERLRAVLNCFRECGLTVRREKCEFGRKSVSFLGFVVDAQGSHIARDRVQAVLDVPAPHNVTELKTFLGMINYYAKFIKNYAMIVNPLYELLSSQAEWQWTRDREKAFRDAKEALVSHGVLVHYDSSKQVKITCDASPVGLGAGLSHVFEDGSVKPIAFASKTLSKAERNYSQLDREALGLVFGVKSFHQYVYGRSFLLETDYKPLVYIFGAKKGLPQMAASRVQRWAVFLSGYQFSIQHIRGIDNGSADGLCRLPLPIVSSELDKADNDEYSYLNLVIDDIATIKDVDIKNETDCDNILSKVRLFVSKGFPHKVEQEMAPFKNRERELTVIDDCIMWGHRVVVPLSLRKRLLDELHGVHMGVIRMKAVARSYIWWPGIDQDIESISKSCELCCKNASNPPRAELNVWKWPDGPGHRIHADFLGPLEGRMYLIIIDAYSKWIDVKEMANITSENSIKAFKEYISIWGLPRRLVTDSGPSFCSSTFAEFLDRNGVEHIRTAPYHPASNGAAENAVKTFKSKFKLLREAGLSRHEALCRFLLHYRSTPHCTTGVTPAELQVNRPLRTRLDLLRPVAHKHVENKQDEQKKFYHGHRKTQFAINDIVMARDYGSNSWCKAKVLSQSSPVTYQVLTEDNRTWKRHLDQLRPCNLVFKESPAAWSLVNSDKRDPMSGDAVRRQSLNTPSYVIDENCDNQTSESDSQAPLDRVICEDNARSIIVDNKRPSLGSLPSRKSIGNPTPSAPVTPEVRRSTRVRKPREIFYL